MSGNDEATTPTSEPENTTVTPADVAAAHEAMKAEGTPEPQEETKNEPQESEGEKKGTTFTQEDVDRIVGERLERDRAKREADLAESRQAQEKQIRDLTIQVQAGRHSLPEDVFEGIATEDIPSFAERLGEVVTKRIAEEKASSGKSGAPLVAGIGTGDNTPVETADDKALRFFKLTK